ncbi:MAG: AMP-binding protein [Clostridia bacterium]|nr:AMP-binding protein [Clostridia bacterium]
MSFETLLDAQTVEKWTKLGYWGDRIITDYLDENVARFPDKVAVVDRRSRYTYRQLADLVDRCALGLLELGIGKGDVVAFQLPNWNEFVIIHYAATRIGAISNPLIPIYRAREIRFMLELGEAKFLLIPREFRGFDHARMVAELWPELPALRHVFVMGGEPLPGMKSWEEFIATPWEERRNRSELANLRPDANDLTELIFTSGTTGEPKGVLHTHNTLMAPGLAYRDWYRLTPDDVLHMASTFAHQTGFLFGVRLPTICGGTGVYQDIWDPAEFLRLIEAEGITCTFGATPFLHDTLKAIEANPGRDLRTLRFFSCFGAPIPRALVREAREKLGCGIQSGWGQTEDALVTICGLDDPEEKIVNTDGRPCHPGMEIKVIGPDGEDLSPGEEGDLLCRGPFLFVGYCKRLEYTRSCFRGDWFQTGDRATIDPDGYVRITGRSKDLIIRGGENIPVAYVENVLHEHPDIDGVAIVAMPDPRLQERACAYVILKPGRTLTLEGMRAFLEAKGVAKQYWPERLEVVAEFPRTPSGKIQKYKLREDIRQKVEQERSVGV